MQVPGVFTAAALCVTSCQWRAEFHVNITSTHSCVNPIVTYFKSWLNGIGSQGLGPCDLPTTGLETPLLSGAQMDV